MTDRNGCGSEFQLRTSSELVVGYDEIKQEEPVRAGKQRVWGYSAMKQRVFLQYCLIAVALRGRKS